MPTPYNKRCRPNCKAFISARHREYRPFALHTATSLLVPEDAVDSRQSEWFIRAWQRTDFQRADAVIAYPKLHRHRHLSDIGQPVANEHAAFSGDRRSVQRKVYCPASAGTLRNHAQSAKWKQSTQSVLLERGILLGELRTQHQRLGGLGAAADQLIASIPLSRNSRWNRRTLKH
jgi:hypothetical protein